MVLIITLVISSCNVYICHVPRLFSTLPTLAQTLLKAYLCYIFSTLAFCVIYHVFSLGLYTSRYNLVFLALSGVMVGLIWVQLFWSLYFLRLLDLYDVYHKHPMVSNCLPT